MKYALSSRQPDEYLKMADEIRVQYSDREIIYDFVEKFPNKTIILEIPYYIGEDSVDYRELDTFNKLLPNFICRISRYDDILQLRELDIKWYYGINVNTWEDLMCLSKTDTQYVLISGDLFFNLPKVKAFGIPIRVVPNVSNTSPFAAQSDLSFDISIVGDWFQPEALSIYEDYIDVIEFENCNPQQERGLYRVWSKDGWPGGLTDIITNLKTNVPGRLINPSYFYTNRLDCDRTCLKRQNAGCQLCYRQFNLADYEKLKKYTEEVLNQKDNT